LSITATDKKIYNNLQLTFQFILFMVEFSFSWNTEDLAKSFQYLAAFSTQKLLDENGKVTSLELKEELRKNYDMTVTQNMCSVFLMSTDIPFSFNGTFRTYTFELNNSTPVEPEEGLLMFAGQLESFTKKEIRKEFEDVFTDEFDLYFDNLLKKGRICFSGKYNNENHRIYAYVPEGSHYSRNSENTMRLNEMAVPHLLNTIRKYYGDMNLEEVFSKEDAFEQTEVFGLLKAYFNKVS
jgi:hypothetical protein